MATTIAARPLFISAAPRPYRMPSLDDGLERIGVPIPRADRSARRPYDLQSTSSGALVAVQRAQMFSTGPNGMRSTLNPAACSRSPIACRQPWSSGLTDGTPDQIAGQCQGVGGRRSRCDKGLRLRAVGTGGKWRRLIQRSTLASAATA